MTSLLYGFIVIPHDINSSHRTPPPPQRNNDEGRQLVVLVLRALSEDFLENDLVAIKVKQSSSSDDETETDTSLPPLPPRLCAVGQYRNVIPLCQRADDAETDLFADPREFSDPYWEDLSDDTVVHKYQEAWYGQLPVPSLGGGPGYGAQADEIWSTTDDVLEQVQSDAVELPVLDVGIAHGEKARGGAF